MLNGLQRCNRNIWKRHKKKCCSNRTLQCWYYELCFYCSTANEKFVLRCSKDENAYKDTVYWLNRLSVCEIPIPIVLSEGKYKDYSYLILSYIRGDDIGNVYCKLNDSEKKQIAKEVVKIQRKVSRLDIHADMEWTWNCFVDKMLNRAEKRIKKKELFWL